MKTINFIKTSDNNFNNDTVIINLAKQFQSCNINILLGAGFSYGVAELLCNVEKEITNAEENGDNDRIIQLKKDFFTKSILPTIDESKSKIGEKERIRFLGLIKRIIDNRQSSILHKIVNIFTTNYDLLIESALERSNVEYIDGFSGKILPRFSTANYGIILSKQTSISSMTSEMTTFNIYKVHGSLNWHCESTDVYRTNPSELINKIYSNLSGDEFLKYYDELSIVNPTKNKLRQTVLDVNYYDQLRLYCNELEKNNTILISYGFSFSDEHILQMTKRALASNPTLNLLIFSFDEESAIKYKEIFNEFVNVTLFRLVKIENGKESCVLFTQEELNNALEEVYNGIK